MNTLEPERTPFRILVLGDSIAWGQGLHPHEKMHSLVANEIQQRNPQLRVTTKMLAHSGAILGDPEDSTPVMYLSGSFGSEVPFTHPTVFQQAAQKVGRRRRDPNVDLVIVGAGINDVHLQHILNPLDDTLDKRIETIFYPRMRALVEKLAFGFPKATIIITGYYAFFTDSSDRNLFGPGLAAFGFGIGGLPGVLGGLALDALAIDAIKARARQFVQQTHASIQAVLDEWVQIAPEVAVRLYFAHPAFADDNAMFAPRPLLFGINADMTPQDPPAIAAGRAAACAEHAAKLDPLQAFGCPRASVGHPNAAGAAQYARAILDQLRFALPSLFVG
jgi:lysophospholipase L1-like esterase